MTTRFEKILITAGPTREMLDPIRYLSNLSTGEMGYALARAARERKYQVTLVSGPTALKPPKGVRFVPVLTAADLEKACRRLFPKHDALIMSAAVCDFTAATPTLQKMRRTPFKKIILKQTPDILAGLAKRKGRRIVIGFCLETRDWLKRAELKLKRKGLDGIVANDYREKKHVPFGDRKVTIALIGRDSLRRLLRSGTKRGLAPEILNWMEDLCKKNSETNRKRI